MLKIIYQMIFFVNFIFLALAAIRLIKFLYKKAPEFCDGRQFLIILLLVTTIFLSFGSAGLQSWDSIVYLSAKEAQARNSGLGTIESEDSVHYRENGEKTNVSKSEYHREAPDYSHLNHSVPEILFLDLIAFISLIIIYFYQNKLNKKRLLEINRIQSENNGGWGNTLKNYNSRKK